MVDAVCKQKIRSPYNRLTLEEKAELIKDHESGMRNIDLVKKYNVHCSTIRRTFSAKERLARRINTVQQLNGDLKIKKFSSVLESPLEKALYDWFKEQHTSGLPVSVRLLQQQALKFHEHYKDKSEFTASRGWVQRFMKRHGIGTLGVKREKVTSNRKGPTGEKFSAKKKDAEIFQEAFNEFVSEHKYKLDNMYNANETGLNWKLFMKQTALARYEVDAPGKNDSEGRVTVQVCANASGTHKIPLLVIGKDAPPKWFQNSELSTSIFYASQDEGWMDREVFLYWFTEIFLPSVKERNPDPDERFILILDNAPCHSNVEELNLIDEQVLVFYLPPNVNTLVQPMNQGVISSLKMIYKTKFLREILCQQFSYTKQVDAFLKSWNLEDCLDVLENAWNSVKTNTLKNSWKHLMTQDTSTLNSNKDIDKSVAKIKNTMGKIPGFQSWSKKKIRDWIIDNSEKVRKLLISGRIVEHCSGVDLNEIYSLKDEEKTEEVEVTNTFEEKGVIPIPTSKVLDAVALLYEWAKTNDTCRKRKFDQETLDFKHKVIDIACGLDVSDDD